jgi:hypothetical protein
MDKMETTTARDRSLHDAAALPRAGAGHGAFARQSAKAFLGALAATALVLTPATARNMGQWDKENPESAWYKALLQPDNGHSCCGEADAYFCDDIHIRDDKKFCSITDTRPDGPRMRPHRNLGEEFEIPRQKIDKGEQGNPTGHSVIFLTTSGIVFCFVAATMT